MTQEQALTILKTGANVFLTGEPGSGKTYTTLAYIEYLRSHGIEPAITASTGIAATHLHGMTIHSFSGMGINKNLSGYDVDRIANLQYINKRIKKTTVLLIDEVSMLDGSMLVDLDKICREVKQNQYPFGGIQVVLIGDFFQLPPITQGFEAKNYAFQSSIWGKLGLITCYITEQHRQDGDDDTLLSVLKAIRNNDVDQMHVEYIESRKVVLADVAEMTTKLFTKNVAVDTLNTNALGKIGHGEKKFTMHTTGKDTLVAQLVKGCLSPQELILKKDAIVMCTKNNPQLGFYNGTLGTVVEFEHYTNYPIIKTKDGRRITMAPMDWTIEEDGKIKAQVTQIPLRLAWAITIHKSQGMSLDEAVIDLSDTFEYGQGYVALSRLRSLSGLHLLGFNNKAFQVHGDVLEQDIMFKRQSEEAEDAFYKLDTEEIDVMHANFLKSIGGISEKKAKAQKLSPTDETLLYLGEGKGIDEIAQMKNVSVATVIEHVHKLALAHKVSKIMVARLIESIDADEIKRIEQTFKKFGTEKLAPVFSHLNEEYTYDELKLVRAYCVAEK
jgi:ATP-dependent DNA helicase PIF1